MVFGFLPPHGRRLGVNEEFTVFGDIRSAIIPFERTAARRNIKAFEDALRRGDLEIIHTPGVILEDDSNPGSTLMIRLRNGSLGVTSPCWNTSSSESPESGG
jgi:hypothetical protein